MKTLFNQGWEFSKQPLHTGFEEIVKRRQDFAPVGIPHDWLIGQAENLYEDSTGWYRKAFLWEKKEGERVFLGFDGIYMDSRIFLNGKQVGEWKYGYSSFEIQLSEALKDGENELWVSVDYQSPNSRWYTGAGIYRNVWLRVKKEERLITDGIYFTAKKESETQWRMEIQTEAAGEDIALSYAVREKGSRDWQEIEGTEKKLGEHTYLFLSYIENPRLWELENPVCYELKVTLNKEGKILDEEVQTIGFRTMEFTPDKGFFLNGVHVKLNGCCEHHDLGCLGAAFHEKAMRRKLRILKDMGVNALRTAHNMPAREVLELADEMGVLIVSEAFDMWEECKNTYDYARFFPTWYEKDVASWVRRDRNHPSLCMWSIGNEIHDTHTGERGKRWLEILIQEVRKHDPKGNGAVTFGSNYMPWENTQKCADVIKITGYNYGEKYYRSHHEKHPDWILYGSETGSVVQSRGIYHFPFSRSVLADEDEQCSALGNSTTSWGAKSPEACVAAEKEHTFSCGQFVWSGFDFLGEPTPYHTRSSYFGQADTAGFLKDSYYIYQSGWTDYRKKPMVHLFPYWDFNEGQLIDVRACSNAPAVELFVNEKSMGKQELDQKTGAKLAGHWQVPYEKGEICAVAYDKDGTVLAKEIRHSFGEAANICLRPEEDFLLADGEDLLFVEISMEDKDGYPVENANNRVFLTIEGQGVLVGTDNGDSTDTDQYKSGSRRLFSGKLLAVIKAGTQTGSVRLTAQSEGLKKAVLEIPVKASKAREGISPLAYMAENARKQEKEQKNREIPVRNLYLKSSQGLILTPENPETRVQARIMPETATDREVSWSIVDDAGIPVSIGAVLGEGREVTVRAKSDGAFRLRCTSKCGTGKVRLISQLEFQVKGFGKAYKNPYEFVSAGLFDDAIGEIGNGNEHGIATARGELSGVGFWELDFGSVGSDEITLPIFALSGEPYRFRIYENSPREGGELLADVIYQKPSKWNQYQEDTYRLSRRLKGVTKLYFLLEDKVHIKGFIFKKYERAWEVLPAGACDRIYGDSFTRQGDAVLGIGNNVTLEFQEMNFGEKGAARLRLEGRTPLEKTSILVSFTDKEGREERQLLEYQGGKNMQEFELIPVKGEQFVQFVFLPGARFDFYRLQFL